MSASRSPWWWPRAPALAEDALEAIALDIEPLPRGGGSRRARRDDGSLLFEATGSNRVDHADRR